MIEPCPSTQSSSPPRSRALDHEPLGGAGDEVGDDGVDRDPPARDRDPGLPRGHEDRPDAAPARLEVELERDRHLPDRAVRADGEHDRARAREVLAGRGREIGGRAAEVAELHPMRLRRARAAPGRRRGRRAGRSRCRGPLDALPAARSRRAGTATLRRDAHERRVRIEPQGVLDALHDRNAVVASRRASASSRRSRRRPRGGSGARRASSSRSEGRR